MNINKLDLWQELVDDEFLVLADDPEWAVLFMVDLWFGTDVIYGDNPMTRTIVFQGLRKEVTGYGEEGYIEAAGSEGP